MIHAIVMAGGSGTRFWPKSTNKRPKQFLNLFGEKTLLQSTLQRLNGLIPAENHLVVTNKQYEGLVRDQLPYLANRSVVTEPVPRNTAPCVAAAARLLLNRDPDAVMVVLPADHHIIDEARFRTVLSRAIDVAEKKRSLVTIGIQPDRPETGYGYIRYNPDHISEGEGPASYRVRQFTEKPDLDQALSFLKSGDYLWNSGMFIWRADVILDALKRYQPEIYQALECLSGDLVDQRDIDRFYQSTPSISIDYGIMEHADEVDVIPGDFGWSDVGSWQAVHELTNKDRDGNSVSGGAALFESAGGNLVESESGKLVALVGVNHLAVVETENSILICDLRNSQDVRSIVEMLKKREELNPYL